MNLISLSCFEDITIIIIIIIIIIKSPKSVIDTILNTHYSHRQGIVVLILESHPTYDKAYWKGIHKAA